MLSIAIMVVAAAAAATPPTALQPDGVVRAGGAVALRWRHSGNRPFFHICVVQSGKQQLCSAGAFNRMYPADAPELDRTLVAAPAVYEYRLDVPQWPWQAAIPNDRALLWRVGVCTNSAPASCVYSADARLHLSTKNVGVQDIDAALGYPVSSFTPIIVNSGATDAGKLTTRISVFNAVFAWNGGCETSLSSPAVAPGDIAVTSAGEEAVLGQADVPDTIGVYRASGVFEGKLSELESSLAVRAGDTMKGETLEQVFPIPFPFPAPLAYLVVVTADVDDALVEYDESDNRLARCYVAYP
jgi:hypothetical protein